MLEHFNRPRPVAWFFFLLCFATTLALGTWQVQRMQWKQSLIAAIEAGKTQPPLSIPSPKHRTLSAEDLPPLEFHRLCLEGGWVNGPDGKTIEFHLFPRFYRDQLGYFIISPLSLHDNRIVLVNRGWVPAEKKLAEKRPKSAVEGVDEVCGIVRLGRERSWVTPRNDANRNLWFGRDTDAMAQFANLHDVLPMMLDLVGKQDAKKLPVPSDGTIRLRNDHLSYVITWYGIAAGILVIFLVYHRKKR